MIPLNAHLPGIVDVPGHARGMVEIAETSDTKGLLVMFFAYLTYGTKRPGANLLFKAMYFPRETFSIPLSGLKSQGLPNVSVLGS